MNNFDIEIKDNFNIDIALQPSIEIEVEIDGVRGMSAYEIALKNGFIGTEQEWLANLVEITVPNADWDATTGQAQILNKPSFKTINNQPIIGTGNIDASQLKYESFTLDTNHINNTKYVEIIGEITDNQSIMLFLDNIGVKAEQGVDYSFSGNQIYWVGYHLDGLLDIGDKLKIYYL